MDINNFKPANKSTGKYTSQLSEIEWQNLSQEIRNFTLGLDQ